MGLIRMTDNKTSTQTANPLEQYVEKAKCVEGANAVELIRQVLEAPAVYVFGELLDVPNIQELANGPYSSYLKLLNLFSYGTFSDYKANETELPVLTVNQAQKLKHLTIVSLATKLKCIPYTLLLKELDLKNLRELEDLIIEGIYADIIHGKLDQKNNQLEVDYAIGRDIGPQDVVSMVSVLQEWSDCCETILNNIDLQIKKANFTKDSRNKQKIMLDIEVGNIKKTLKTSTEDDDQVCSEMREVSSHGEKPKKAAKTKGYATPKRGEPGPGYAKKS